MSQYSSFHSPSESRLRWALLIVMLLLLLYLNRNFILSLVDHGGRDPNAEPRVVTPRGDLAADEQATIEIFQVVSPSVAYVTTKSGQYWRQNLFSLQPMQVEEGTGSGFVWDKEGHVVTNYHVIAHAVQTHGQCYVRLKNSENVEAEVVGADPEHDIAVLFIRTPASELKPIPIGTSADLLVGQKVFAIGNPFGYDYTLTTGVVSALDRTIQTKDGQRLQSLIQTDAAISPGSSGGPLMDSAGRLIGMMTAVADGEHASNIGFALPVDIINRVVPQLIRQGGDVQPEDRAVLGIRPVDENILRLNKINTGVMVGQVYDNSPAAAAGLRGIKRLPNGQIGYGDLIIDIDGKKVRNFADYQELLRQHKPGDKIKLTLLRDGKQTEVEATLGASNH